jgi:hypothetical protein
MEIKKNNIEIRKNWNKFSFKKLGAVFCLFLFGVVTFVSGNLTQVNAASSSTVLPVAKGGTGANSASGARTNLNAQETLVSGTNIKSVFGQSLLGSGNMNNITSSTSNINIGQIGEIRSNDNIINGWGIQCAYSSGNCNFYLSSWGDVFLQYTSSSDYTMRKYLASDDTGSGKTVLASKILPASNVSGFISGDIATKYGNLTFSVIKDEGNWMQLKVQRYS